MGQMLNCADCGNDFDEDDGMAFAIDDDGNMTSDTICKRCATWEELDAFELIEDYPPEREKCFRCMTMTKKYTEDHTPACGLHGGK